MWIWTKKYITSVGAACALFIVAGCAGGGLTTREKSTLGGAALGAGAGALIGEATDSSPGTGALIGGGIGALGGALAGGAAQSRDEDLYTHQRELERQRYELERQRRELEDVRRGDRYYDRDYRSDPYYNRDYYPY